LPWDRRDGQPNFGSGHILACPGTAETASQTLVAGIFWLAIGQPRRLSNKMTFLFLATQPPTHSTYPIYLTHSTQPPSHPTTPPYATSLFDPPRPITSHKSL